MMPYPPQPWATGSEKSDPEQPETLFLLVKSIEFISEALGNYPEGFLGSDYYCLRFPAWLLSVSLDMPSAMEGLVLALETSPPSTLPSSTWLQLT